MIVFEGKYIFHISWLLLGTFFKKAYLYFILFNSHKQNETGQKEIDLEDFKVTDKYHAEKIVSDSLGIVDVL